MVKYPLYIKLQNGLSWYKIISDVEYEEVKLIGKRYAHSHMKATDYSQQLFISDLVKNFSDFNSLVTEEDYNAFVASCEKDLEKITL